MILSLPPIALWAQDDAATRLESWSSSPAPKWVSDAAGYLKHPEAPVRLRAARLFTQYAHTSMWREDIARAMASPDVLMTLTVVCRDLTTSGKETEAVDDWDILEEMFKSFRIYPQADLMPFLLEQLQSPDPERQRLALWSMELKRDDRIVTPVVRILEDPNRTDSLDYHAAIALGNVGDERAAPVLLQIFQTIQEPKQTDPSRDVPQVRTKKAIAEALGKIGGKKSIAALCEGAQDRARHLDVRRACIEALGRIAEDSAFKVLSRCAMERALRARTPAEQKREDRDAEVVRITAVHALCALGKDRALTILKKALAHDTEPVRLAVVVAVRRFGAGAFEMLIDAAFVDTHPQVRFLAMEGLRRYTFLDLPFDKDAPEEERGVQRKSWLAWWKENRARKREEWLTAALTQKGYRLTTLDQVATLEQLVLALEDRDWWISLGAGEALETLTGKSFGGLDPETAKDTRLATVQQWKDWFAKNRTVLVWNTEKKIFETEGS